MNEYSELIAALRKDPKALAALIEAGIKQQATKTLTNGVE